MVSSDSDGSYQTRRHSKKMRRERSREYKGSKKDKKRSKRRSRSYDRRSRSHDRRSRSYDRSSTSRSRHRRSRSRDRRSRERSRERTRERSRERSRERTRERSRDRYRHSRSASKETKVKSAKEITQFDLMSKVEQAQARIAQRLGEIVPNKSSPLIEDYDPVKEFERQKRIKEIEGDSFVANTFSSSRKKKLEVLKSEQFSQPKQKFELNLDLDFIMNEKFLEDADVRMENWKTKLNRMAMKLKNKFS